MLCIVFFASGRLLAMMSYGLLFANGKFLFNMMLLVPFLRTGFFSSFF